MVVVGRWEMSKLEQFADVAIVFDHCRRLIVVRHSAYGAHGIGGHA